LIRIGYAKNIKNECQRLHRYSGPENYGRWLPLATVQFWLATNSSLGIYELAFGILVLSLGQLWHRENVGELISKDVKINIVGKSSQLVFPLKLGFFATSLTDLEVFRTDSTKGRLASVV
jgi:hypothetical protein